MVFRSEDANHPIREIRQARRFHFMNLRACFFLKDCMTICMAFVSFFILPAASACICAEVWYTDKDFTAGFSGLVSGIARAASAG